MSSKKCRGTAFWMVVVCGLCAGCDTIEVKNLRLNAGDQLASIVLISPETDTQRAFVFNLRSVVERPTTSSLDNIGDAEVLLAEMGAAFVPFTLSDPKEGLYVLTNDRLSIREDRTYQVRINHQGRTLTGTAHVLQPLIGLEVTRLFFNANQDDWVLNLDVQDRPGEENSYQIFVYAVYDEREPEGEIKKQRIWLNEENNLDRDLLYDEGQDGNKLSPILGIELSGEFIILLQRQASQAIKNLSLDIVVLVSDHNYYRFVKASRSRNTFFSDLFNEPNIFPSQLNGGLGFISAYRIHTTHITDLQALIDK